jgi:integrase
MKARKHPGIEERRDADGRTRFRARVRRRGAALRATFPTLSEALAWRATTLEAIDAGAPVTPPRATSPRPPSPASTVEIASRRLVRGMIDQSLRSRDGLPYKPSVIRTYEESLRLRVLPHVGGLPVGALTRGDVQRLVDGIAAASSPNHARKALTALRVVLRVCERYGEIERNPCDGVRVPTSHEHVERPARILTPGEVAAIVDAAATEDVTLAVRRAQRGETTQAAPLLALLAGTGLRLGEALALPWGRDGLDLDGAVVNVRRSLDRQRGRDGQYAFVAPKTRSSRRSIPLAASDAARLREYREVTKAGDGALVFADRRGEALPPQALPRQALARACRCAGMAQPWPRVHDLRHAYATHLLRAGLTAHAVARLLGHSDAGLVHRRYGHALPDELQLAGGALETFRAHAADAVAPLNA